MLQTLTSRLFIAAAMLALGAASASGAVVTRTFTISGVTLADLYSATFDAPLTPCGASPTQECTFFNGTTPTGRAVVHTNNGTGSGTMNVNYEDTTGEIKQVNSLLFNMPDLTLVISGSTTVNVIQGNSLPVVNDNAFVESGTGTLGRDLDGPAHPQTLLGVGTVDPDQAPAIGQFTIFHHNDSPNQDVPDFAVFTDIVDTCTGPLCGLITSGLLTLDGIKYRLEGRIGCGGSGHALVLKTQTANNSIYRANLTATAVDADCDGDTIANAFDNCPDVANVGQADDDVDGRGNMCDNCRMVVNNTGAGAQADSDNDGFGNRCDADLSNNGASNAQDTSMYRPRLGTLSVHPAYNAADINANGVINAQDTSIFRTLLGVGPGPGAGP